MKLTNKQQQALEIALNRYNNKEKYTAIAGFAGTGKTFVAKKIIEHLGIQEKELLVGAFTGKAAFKLQESGFKTAQTLHKIRYRSFKNQEGEWVHIKHPVEKYEGFKAILIDEISMVPKKIIDDIFEIPNLHVIVLGDPGQLPPVGADNGLMKKPNIFLDEIMRQSGDNDIVKLSHMIRTGEVVKVSDFKDSADVTIIKKDDLDENLLVESDQILCAKNDTRKELNRRTRSLLGRKFRKPEVGEKVIMLNNRWDVVNEEKMPLINGMIGTVKSIGQKNQEWETYGRSVDEKLKVAPMEVVPETENGDFEFMYDLAPFYRDGAESAQIDKDHRFTKVDFGYAITVHKSQGSEYENVLGFEETLNRAYHRRWLYTLVTRARKKITIVADENSSVFDFR